MDQHKILHLVHCMADDWQNDLVWAEHTAEVQFHYRTDRTFLLMGLQECLTAGSSLADGNMSHASQTLRLSEHVNSVTSSRTHHTVRLQTLENLLTSLTCLFSALLQAVISKRLDKADT